MFVELPTVEALAVTLIVTVIRTILEASPTILGGVHVGGLSADTGRTGTLEVAFSGRGHRRSAACRIDWHGLACLLDRSLASLERNCDCWDFPQTN